jgi:hypothetical protein
MFPYGEAVTFEALADGAVDAHGNPVDSYGPPLVVQGCAFDPGGSVEQYTPGRDAVISSPRVFIPAGVSVFEETDLFVLGDDGTRIPVSPRDRVTVRGITYEVQGDPADWVNPFTGWAPGGVVNLERVAG